MSKNQYGRSGLEPRTALEERTRRYEDMTSMRAQGYTLDQIAAKWGVSRERVRQILRSAPKLPGRPLPSRTLSEAVAETP